METSLYTCTFTYTFIPTCCKTYRPTIYPTGAGENPPRHAGPRPDKVATSSLPRPPFYPLYTLNRDHIPIFKGYKEGPGTSYPAAATEKLPLEGCSHELRTYRGYIGGYRGDLFEGYTTNLVQGSHGFYGVGLD